MRVRASVYAARHPMRYLTWPRFNRALFATSLVSAAVATACLVDPDQRCGPNQEYDGKRCICTDGYGLVDNACVKCGKHEQGSLAGCACSDGYVRKTPDGKCEELDELGAACASDDDCIDPAYGYCAHADGDGYCTSADCSASADCETAADYSCNAYQTPSFCERPPTGLGTSCTSSDDCAGFAAGYCEVISEHVCLVGGCKDDPTLCHGAWVCCDIPVLSNSICVPQTSLADGACPAGGTLIARPK